MPTQPQPTFPADQPPIRPITDPLAIQQTLTLVHQFGMFLFHQRLPNKGSLYPSATVVHAEPCLDPAYPEGFIYWMEKYEIYEDEPGELKRSRALRTGEELVKEMAYMDTVEMRGWQIFQSNKKADE